jgi:hypothetical protein
MFAQKGRFRALIEGLLVLAFFLAILFGIYRLANIGGKFTQSRNVQRSISVETLIDAVYIYLSQNGSPPEFLREINPCSKTPSHIGTQKDKENYIDLAKTLQGTYLPILPKDPSIGTDADTGYTICLLENNRIRVDAPHAEDGQKISVKK